MMEDVGSICWDHSTRVEQLVYKSDGCTPLHLKTHPKRRQGKNALLIFLYDHLLLEFQV